MKLSQILSELLIEHRDRPLPLHILLKQVGRNGFGTISGIFTLPMLIPSPIPLAGLSALMGSGIILMGCQLALGLEQPYLPRWLARQELSPKASAILLQNLNRLLQPLERIAKQRLVRFSNGGWGHRIIGICLAWNALLMSLPLPIPLTNLLPAYTILFLTIGILERDGLFVLIGYGGTVATTLFFVSISSAIWKLAVYWWAFIAT